ncbi:MAG: phage holin family protein [Acidimicrobiales bacterium]
MSERAAPTGDRPLGDLLGDVTSHLSQLIHHEVELGKMEATEQLGKATKAGLLLGAAAVLGLLGLAIAAVAAAWALAVLMPTGLAFALVAVILLGVAGALVGPAKRRLEGFHLMPREAKDMAAQDIRSAKSSLKRGLTSDVPPARATSRAGSGVLIYPTRNGTVG